MIPSEAPKDPCLPSFLELTQALGRLVADVENAKRFGNEQLAFFEQQINDLKSVCDGLLKERDDLLKERDDAIDQLKAICKEKDQLDDQLSSLGMQLDELRGAKQESADARRETELALSQLARVQKELEHYFLLSSQQFKLLDEYKNLEARAAVLLSMN